VSLDPSLLFDPNLRQPFVDEMSVGYNRQLPGQISVGAAFTHRRYQDNFAEVDINGFYPTGRASRSAASAASIRTSGHRHPADQQHLDRRHRQRGGSDLRQEHGQQLPDHRQRHLPVAVPVGHLEPHGPGAVRPAGRVQANNRDLSQQLFGNGDDNTLNGGGRESGAAYRPFSVRIGGQWNAPWGISVGGSYVIQAGGFVGPLLVQLPANDPQVTQFGPSTVRLANGRTQPNPLATRLRFQGPTRSDGQIRNDDAKFLQLKIGRVFRFGTRSIEPAANIFNVFNTTANTQWNVGANQTYSPNYLARFNRHPPRSLQLSVAVKF
jgi:hypothetical protein